MKSQKTKMIAAAICLFVGMTAFSQEEKSKDKKRERPTPEKMFEDLDANKDGKITKDEFKNERMAKRFLKMDTDGDKAISLKELKTSFEKAQKARKERPEGERPRRDWGNDGGNNGGMNDGGGYQGGEE